MTTPHTLHETTTTAAPADVLSRAKAFFSSRPSLYAAFLDKEGDSFCTFRGQGGEEIVIAAGPGANGQTLVTGSSYLFDMQIARFFTTLPGAAGPGQ